MFLTMSFSKLKMFIPFKIFFTANCESFIESADDDNQLDSDDCCLGKEISTGFVFDIDSICNAETTNTIN